MNYDFLVSTYQTERLKVLSVWSMFRDEDLNTRPHPADPRGRSVREQMIHQCQSEDLWFRRFFAIDVGSEVLPKEATRLEFIRKYGADSEQRARMLASQKGGLVGAGGRFLHDPAYTRVGDGPADRSYGPSSWATDRAAADAQSRDSFHLRADC